MHKIFKIIDSATELFAQKGFENTTVQEIADHAQLAAGTIIYHFKTKNNLLFIIIRGMLVELIKHTEQNMKACATPNEKIISFIDSLTSYFENNPNHLLLCIKSSPFLKFNAKSFPSAEIYVLTQKYLSILENIVSDGISMKVFHNVCVDEFCLLVIVTLFSTAAFELFFSNTPKLNKELLNMVRSRLFILEQTQEA